MIDDPFLQRVLRQIEFEGSNYSAFGKKIGVDASALRKTAKRNGSLRVSTQRKILDYYNVTEAEFLSLDPASLNSPRPTAPPQVSLQEAAAQLLALLPQLSDDELHLLLGTADKFAAARDRSPEQPSQDD